MKWTDPHTGTEYNLRRDAQYDKEVSAICRQFNCKHEKLEIVWCTTADGRRQLRNRCERCGELCGGALKRELATRETPPGDWLRHEAWMGDKQIQLNEAARRLVKRQASWWAWYDDYLATDAWRHKRRLVMQRANGLCEGCRERPAAQVHHLTYANVGNEFLFELVALCGACHERVHGESAGPEAEGTPMPPPMLAESEPF
jgi:5-methylcytosine-specific restriction endonuclease McrA